MSGASEGGRSPREACPECGSERRIWDAALIGGVLPSRCLIQVEVSPGTPLRPAKLAVSEVFVTVCADCAHVRLEALDPDLLWKAFQEREARA